MPLPEKFDLPKIASPKPKLGNPNLVAGPGRPKGLINKFSKDLKQGIIEGAAAFGCDGTGAGGLHGYLAMCAARYPKHYLAVLAKMLPLQIYSDVHKHSISTVNIVSVPSDRYLSPEDIERIRSPEPLEPSPVAQIEHKLQEEPEPEIAPQTPAEAQLIGELKGLSIEELTERARRVGIDVDSS